MASVRLLSALLPHCRKVLTSPAYGVPLRGPQRMERRARGRGGGIRTHDANPPKIRLYQTELHPDAVAP